MREVVRSSSLDVLHRLDRLTVYVPRAPWGRKLRQLSLNRGVLERLIEGRNGIGSLNGGAGCGGDGGPTAAATFTAI